jgi:aspartate 1-decarboxylase
MLYKVLKSKLHRAAVTDVKVNYPGSIEIDAELMNACGLNSYESVIVADLENGNRLETYVVPAESGSRRITILGAAARLINPGNRVIIMNFGFVDEEELKQHIPKIIILDEKNNIIG